MATTERIRDPEIAVLEDQLSAGNRSEIIPRSVRSWRESKFAAVARA